MTVALLVIDHGSKQKEANDMLLNLVDLIRQEKPDLIVEGAHMELAEPTIPAAVSRCVEQGATHIIAHPYMLSPGRHATKDIPHLVQNAVAEFPTLSCEVTPPLGIDTDIIRVILKRAKL